MRVIGENYSLRHKVDDDSILLCVESENPETVRWGKLKEAIHEDDLLYIREELEDFGVCYIPTIKETTETYRLVE